MPALLPNNQFPSRSMICAAACLLWCCGLGQLNAQEIRTWVSADGKFSVRATLVDHTGDRVLLKRADSGSEITVPVAKLSASDRAFLQSSPTRAPETGASVDVKLAKLATDRFELAPFCKIGLPAPDYTWQLTGQQPPQITASHPEIQEVIRMSVLKSAFTLEEQQARAREFYADVNQRLQADANISVSGGREIDLSYVDELGRCIFTVEAQRDGQTFEYHGWIDFRGGRTFAFETEGDRGYQLMAGTIRTLMANVDPQAPGADIPDAVRDGVQATIDRLRAQLDAEAYEELLKDAMPKDVYEKFQQDPEDWNRVVSRFRERKAAELSKVLAELDWSNATYDKAKQMVTFPSVPRQLKLKMAGGKWQVQN